MPVNSYKTLTTSVRPARVACLVDINEADWHERILVSIESFSRTWGGANFIIVPTDGRTISNPFWQILLAYDPDYFWTAFRSNNRNEQEISLSIELVNQIKLKIAPFHFESSYNIEIPINNLLVKTAAYPNFSPEYPFTDILAILPFCEHSNEVIEISNLEGIMKVWTCAVTGIFSPKSREELNSLEIVSVQSAIDNNSRELFTLVVNGNFGGLYEGDAAFPFAVSSAQMAFARSWEFPDYNEATIVIVGDTLQDFCLYYCLSRMRRKVAWLLPSWLPEEDKSEDMSSWYGDTPISHFVSALKDLGNINQGSGSTVLISLSLEETRINEIRERFNTSPRNFSFQEELPMENGTLRNNKNYDEYLSLSLHWLLRYPIRFYELGNAHKPISKPFIDSEIAGFLETPKPKNFTRVDPFKHLWLTEFLVEKQQFPRHPLLGTEIVRGVSSSWEARSGREGVVYFSQRSGYASNDIDQVLRNVSIRLPDAITIFFTLLQNLQYKVDISDKGRFALSTISKFGSVSRLANFLLTYKGKVFEKYVEEKFGKAPENDKNEQKKGFYLNSNNRRYLDFAAFTEILGNEVTASSLIYYLLEISVLHRGLILKCKFCRGTDWYDIIELSREFRCKRCSLSQIYNQFHLLNKLEPAWYYKLDEIVFNAITQNAVYPILALNYLQEKAKSFDYSPELVLLDPKTNEQLFELDICCIVDGQLTIGEVKKINKLGKNEREEKKLLSKYYDLAEKLGVSQIVFATASEQWRDKTEEMIINQFSNSLIKVILLTKKELYRLSEISL